MEKGGKMISKKVNSVQEWLPVDEILENGIIKVKNKNYIKILKIIPINFELKSNLEKEAILNSYKIFLKTCNFDIQILIQSNKKDLSNHISKIKEKNKEEKENIKILSEKYTNYIKKINTNINEKIIFDKLNDKYFCIKECLSRCGNVVIDISDQKNAEKILYSFFNSRKDLLEI